MKTASLTKLRSNLGRYLRAVQRGETIEILDREVPVARLVPLPKASRQVARRSGTVPPGFWKLVRRGAIKLGSMKPVREILERDPPGSKPTGAVEALLEERRSGR